ncbi:MULTISPECIES: Lsa16 family lipoprotein adhesin [Leptospira]|uniref:SH3 domain-containing protein n=2 Tax=Leptospira TaxID=171 RepID=A0A4V3JC44_9LEPT|nr:MULTISPECIES: hypothetical protein [Leptospira]PKA14804.1 hypothetical protein CH363_16465 [Leptospira haakeii]PKA18566.1 hypothetical protein CH377_17075 [Leptospira haakeii]TGK04649.1 hypothetical protein EHO58_12205 [Leptospira selangorensis]TGM10604.1 hypothetical protein EHQ81_19015 [Leptospira selangorensis]TGM26073.1 hypothetical protein EHQ82_04645 [Leptospira selangorensis]
MKKLALNITILGIAALALGACSNTAQIVGNINCPTLEKGKLDPKVGILSDDQSNPVPVEFLPVGTVVKVYDYRNHYYIAKKLVRIKTEKNEGWVDPVCLVVAQNPDDSVFKWGYRSDYKPFLDREDRDRYNHKNDPNAGPDSKGRSADGFEYDIYRNLPKDKVPLADLAPELKK